MTCTIHSYTQVNGILFFLLFKSYGVNEPPPVPGTQNFLLKLNEPYPLESTLTEPV